MKRFYKKIAVRVIAMLLPAVLWSYTAQATDYISDLVLVGGTKDEVNNLIENYKSSGWTLVNKDLNAGAGGDYIYLLYKTASSDGINRGYITGFYIKKGTWPYPDDLKIQDIDFHLTTYKGGEHFRGQRGDLNSGTGEDTDPIHLYYTRDLFSDKQVVTGITFNSDKDGAVGANGGSVGYDLNAGAGGDYIYMHYTTATGIPDLVGEGTVTSPHWIWDADDWHVFATDVKNGLKANKVFGLLNDLTVSEMVGTSDHPFTGQFYGLRHNLELAISSSEDCAAPFHYVNGAVINGVKTSGQVACVGTGNGHPSGLVGSCFGDSVTIEDCVVLSSVYSNLYAGGIVGHGGSGKVALKNCVFRGEINGFTGFAAGLVGWCDDAKLTLHNCIAGGDIMAGTNGKFHPIACRLKGSKAAATSDDVFYLKDLSQNIPADNFVPGVVAEPVNTSFVENEWDTPLSGADSMTYFAAHLPSPKVLPYKFRFEYSLCDWTVSDLQKGSGLTLEDSSEGINSFKFETSDHPQYLISPELKGYEHQFLSFDLKGTADVNVKFQIGISSKSNNIEDFNWSDVYDTSVPRWGTCEAHLKSNVKYLAIKCLAEGSALFIDNFRIEEEGIYTPVDVAATDITTDAATLQWDGNSDSYTIRYRPQPYFLETFDVGKPHWMVHNEGGNDRTNWSLRDFYSFTSQLLHGHNGGDIVALGRSYDYSGQTAYKVDNWLITPQVDLGGILSYWLLDDGTKHEHYEIWISTTECVPSAFTKFSEPGHGTRPYQWEEIVVDLRQFQGQKGYIAFRLMDEGKNFLAIDDVALYASDWVTVTSNVPSMVLTGLLSSTGYDCQVQGTKNGQTTGWSSVVSFTTLQSQEDIDAIEQVVVPANVDDDAWYDMNGRRLSTQPTRPGLYIHNGKKIHRR